MMKYGKIKLYTGPMFSGKTSRMISDVDRYRLAGKDCVIIRHSSDTRYTNDSTHILTHSGQEYAKTTILLSNSILSLNLDDYDVIGIDETQFFEDCVPGVEKLVSTGKIVICAAIDATYQVKPFGDVHIISAMAEQVEKLSAVCFDCGNDASFTARTSPCKTEIEVGGLDKYIPVCRQCYWTKYKSV